jgi:parallel beta-helix repeat protein
MKLERKLTVVGCCTMLICLGLWSALATRTITDTSDSIYTSITTSAGGVYALTFAGLQSACYANVTGGWTVTVPSCNITFTNTLRVKSNCWLRGNGVSTIFYAAANLNKSMIKPYGYPDFSATNVVNSGANNITFSDFMIDGNMYHNYPFYRASNQFDGMCAINMPWSNDSKVYNLVIKNIYSGIHFQMSNRLSIHDCFEYNIGLNYTGHGEVAGLACGASFHNCNNISIFNIQVYNVHSQGIQMENNTWRNGVQLLNQCYTALINNCIVDKCYEGIHIEGMQRIIVSSCAIRNATKTEAYTVGQPSGIFIGRWSDNAKVISNKLTNVCVPNKSMTSGDSGILISSDNCSLEGNTINTCYENGTLIRGANCIVQGNTIKNCYYYGIVVLPSRNIYPSPIIIGNQIATGFHHGIFISSSAAATYRTQNKYGIVSDNVVVCNVTTPTTIYGIYNRVSNITLNGNTIYKYAKGIYSTGNNCMINDNTISSTASNGIYMDANYNCTANSNRLINCGGIAIILVSCKNSTVIGNKISKCGSATGTITENTAGDSNLIVNNNVNGGNTNNAIVIVGTTSISSCNLGYGGIQLPTVAPVNPVAGSMYCNTTTGKIGVYSGSSYIWN